MAGQPHQNFAIDQEVDKVVNQIFEEMVNKTMTESNVCQQIPDNELRRRIAIGMVLFKKEEYKLLKKRKAASKLKKKPTHYEEKENRRERNDPLHKTCLLRAYAKRKMRERRLRLANEEMELHEQAAKLEESLFQSLFV